MRSLFLFSVTIAVLALPLIAQQPAATPSKPGLYMILDTSMGTITCRLFEKQTPVTVHNIVGLALGKISYTDPTTRKKVVGKKFYDGLTFHRVIPGFMIQTGDPTGTGSGGPEGPGFPFQNEVVSGLQFDAPGMLGMANAGPDTNSSQFFITEVATPFLTGKYTVFGQCGNISVVRDIARVPRDANDRPLKPVLLQQMTIKRVGPVPPNAPEAQ